MVQTGVQTRARPLPSLQLAHDHQRQANHPNPRAVPFRFPVACHLPRMRPARALTVSHASKSYHCNATIYYHSLGRVQTSLATMSEDKNLRYLRDGLQLSMLFRTMIGKSLVRFIAKFPTPGPHVPSALIFEKLPQNDTRRSAEGIEAICDNRIIKFLRSKRIVIHAALLDAQASGEWC
jgi:hypothetical protein